MVVTAAPPSGAHTSGSVLTGRECPKLTGEAAREAVLSYARWLQQQKREGKR